MTEEEIDEKKREEITAAQMIGFTIMQAINLIFIRWKEKGWETVNAKKLMITITVEEPQLKKKKKKKNNNKTGLYS